MLLLILATLVSEGVGFANFLSMIPNGRKVSNKEWHALGHYQSLPDMSMPHLPFKRNEFGKGFFRAGHKWTRAFCETDSDGDGLSNGEELGDPDCIWQPGQTPARTHNITHPGVPDNLGMHKPLPATEVDIPPAFNVSDAAFSPANGVYALVRKNPEAYVWDKRLGKYTYVWRNENFKADCTLWMEKKSSWGVTCDDTDVSRSGGMGPLPFPEADMNDKALKVRPLQDKYPAPKVPELPIGEPIKLSTYYLLVYGMPSFVVLAFILKWKCAWLPPVRLPQVICTTLWLHAGMAIGIHRFFSHRCMKCGFWVKNIIALAAGMNVQDNPLIWASMHRVHHRACDMEIDFHSPVASNRGFWFSHMGWLQTHKQHARLWGEVRIDDLLEDKDLWLAPYYSGDNMMLAYILTSFMVAVLVTARYKEYRESIFQLPALFLYYFGVYAMLPVSIMWHATSFINSATHLWGERPFVDGMMPHMDLCESRNVPWLFPLQLGENWHNNHHAAPGSASTWVEWWQVDICYMEIRALELLGLVWDVRVELPAATRPDYGKEAGGLPFAQFLGCVVLVLSAWAVHRHLLRGMKCSPKTALAIAIMITVTLSIVLVSTNDISWQLIVQEKPSR